MRCWWFSGWALKYTTPWQVLQLQFTIGPGLFFNGWHIPFIRNQLTKGIEEFTMPLMEEFKLCMEDHMMLNSGKYASWRLYSPRNTYLRMSSAGQWTSVKAYNLCSALMARGMSRTFVGLELCKYLLVPRIKQLL